MVDYVCLGNDGEIDDYVRELQECCCFVVEYGTISTILYVICVHVRGD